MANVLIVLTSHSKLGDTGKPTGFYFDEMATPYWTLVDAGHKVSISSINGGKPIHDPSSIKENKSENPEAVERFLNDNDAMASLSKTVSIVDLQASDFDAVFLPGGHGTMYDFPNNEALASIIGKIFDVGGTVAAVCHGPAGLVSARRSNGRPVVEGLRINSFTDAEEETIGLTDIVPFLLERRLRELGGKFEGTDNFKEYAVQDGQLVTGQNPASAGLVAAKMLKAISEQK
ncbi:MAG TPA: type 1 glutamine amidotransferase domain-containing protein [Rhodospirillales bacterium]|nr:type 1 glutamine amidotransferase domain-containing protein [Rhodospirillales bacterium]